MLIMPSILTANLTRLADEIDRVPSADAIHIDVMDNHFVPNLTMGYPMIEAIRDVTEKPLDLHLMIERPDRWALEYAEIGAQTVTFHAEATHSPVRLARELRKLGVGACLGLCPVTPIEPYAGLFDEFDRILIMTVEPGFGGQLFLDSMLEKVARAKALARGRGIDLAIQVDGGVSLETIGRCAEAGADVFVSGVAVYRADDPDAMVRELRKIAEANAPHDPQ